jgi:predicted DNA-binding transcriptional regulator AlpA
MAKGRAQKEGRMTKLKYLKEHEVAKMTGLSLSKLRQDRHKCRGLPYHKIGAKCVRYCINDIWKFMDECRIEHNNT